MRIEYLYYFLVISEAQSLNKAANKLFISQQQLSRIVSSLENEFQTKLLYRTPNGVNLTADGEILKSYAVDIVNKSREMHSYFYLNNQLPKLQQSKSVSGRCKLILPFSFSLVLNNFIGQFRQKYQNIDLQCYEHQNDFTAEDFDSSEALYLIIDDNNRFEEMKAKLDLISYHIGDCTAYYCVNKNSDAAKLTVLSQKDLPKYKLTVYPYALELYKNTYEDNKSNILFISSNINQHLESVVNNQTICSICSFVCNAVQEKYPQISFVASGAPIKIPMYVLHNRKHAITASEIETIHFLSQYIQNLTSFQKL